jgi:hypothetical protein
MVHLPVNLADHVKEIIVVVARRSMWQNMRVHQGVTNNPCPHINPQLVLVSRIDYTEDSPLSTGVGCEY